MRMKSIIKYRGIIVLMSYVFILPAVSLAQGRIENPIKATSLSGFIHDVLEGVLKIGIPIVALAIIYCGFLFVSARGKPEAITKARDALLYTLIGSAILLGAWAIAELINTTVTSLG